MDAVDPFTSQDLEVIGRWLEEAGEVFVAVDFSYRASSQDNHLIRSLDDFVALVVKERASPYAIVSFDVYRGLVFPYRGLASDELARRACAMIPDGRDWWIVDPHTPPLDDLEVLGGDDSHDALRLEIDRLSGRFVAIGSHPMDDSDETWDREYPGSTIRRCYTTKGSPT